MSRLNIPVFQQQIVPKTRMELPWYQFLNKQADVLDAFYVTTLEAHGATGGNVNNDTKALQKAMSGAGTIIDGRGKEYYIGEGVSCAERTYIKNCRLKIKLGTGGFTSTNNHSNFRYATTHCMLHWNNVDGGGVENCEFYGDGGGEYICLAVAVSDGMDTRPFLMGGVNYFHDLTGINSVVRLNGVHDAGYLGDTLYFRDIGTTKDSTWWFTDATLAGTTPTSQIQVTGFTDGDDAGEGAERGRIEKIVGYNIYEIGAAWADPVGQGQVDLATFSGTNYGHGPSVGLIYGELVMGEVLDCFRSGVQVDRIVAKNTGFALLKLIHGADNCHFGNVHALGGVGRFLVSINGSTSAVDTANNSVDSVTGEFSSHAHNFGSLLSATATTAVLPVSFGAGNDDYFAQGGGWSISLVTGTGSPATVKLTGYTASTRTITVASWPSGTPDSTTTFVIVAAKLVSATATTAVLPDSASSRDDYYFKAGGSWVIKLITGTGAPAEVNITDYTGSTRTVTVASWPSGTPDNTTTYKILQWKDRCAVAMENEGSGTITNNTVNNVAVKNTDSMDNIARSNIAVANRGNVIVINHDMGYDVRAVNASTAEGVRFRPGPGMHSHARMDLNSDQGISTVNETLITFDTSDEDTYTRNGVSGLQVDTTNNGIRQLLPGPKRFTIQLHYSLVVSSATTTVRFKRDGATIFIYVHQFGVGTGAQTCTMSGSINHLETWFGTGNENLYTVTVVHSSASAHTISSNGAQTWFSMTDA